MITPVSRYPRYKPSNIPWLGHLPEHWEVVRIKSIIESEVNGIWGDEEKGNGNDIVCLRVADFDRGFDNILEDKITYRNIAHSDFQKRELVFGDLLIEKSGGGEISPVGRVGIYSWKDKKAVCSNFMARIRPNKAKAYPKFLNYFFKKTYSQRINVRSIKQTTGIQNLDTYSYFNEFIPIPPLPEQTAIAHYLDTKTAQIDRLIAAKQQLLALLREERTALIQHAVTRGLNPEAKMKDSGVAWLGEVPEGWEVKKLKYIFDCFDSIRVPLNADERGVMEKNYDYYGASGVIDKVENYLFDGDYILIGEDGANLLTRSTALAFKASGKFWVNNHAHIICPKNGDIDYFVNLLESIDYSIWVSGSAQPKLTSENLLNIALCEPPLSEQSDIAKFIGEIDLKVNYTTQKITAEIALLQEYRIALISEVVTGKIKITES